MTPAAMVREAQRILGSLGYDAGPADGHPGNKTLDAVREFERDKGLAVTGRIDGRLMDALQKAAI
jgi:localization factor PodJL